MFGRIANGLDLAKASWSVLKLDKEMLLFPILSGIACLAVVASFALPLIGSDYLRDIMQNEQVPQDATFWMLMFVFYFTNYLVIVFFNVALVSCALIRFEGGDPTVADGLKSAASRLPEIVTWAFVCATVGIILKVLESKSKRGGRFAAGLLGMAWSVSTYFVIPVLVAEKVGPFQAIRRSLAILRRTWGEALVSNVGIGLAVFLAGLVCCVPALLGVLAGSSYNQPAFVVGGVAVTVILLILVSLISSVLNTVIIAALYHYAASGSAPQNFDRNALQDAFHRR